MGTEGWIMWVGGNGQCGSGLTFVLAILVVWLDTGFFLGSYHLPLIE